MEPSTSRVPLAPPLPKGRLVALDRGEFFVRMTDPPAVAEVPVLLLHGWQATADLNFFPLFDPLAACHRLIAPDLRGHGRSLYPEEPFRLEDAADDQAALLHHLGIGRAIVVGYSLGSAVAQVLAHRHPTVVAGLVLMGGELGGHHRPHEKVYDRIGGWQGTAQRATSGRWGARRIVSKSVRENPAAEALRPWLVAEMERGHAGSLRAAGRALASFDGGAIAAPGRLPVTVVVTRRDRLVRPLRQERLAEAWGAKTIDVDADHDAPVAQPDRFTRALQDAIAATAAAVGTEAARRIA
jgi:3-oxoadipate enol-lactonase